MGEKLNMNRGALPPRLKGSIASMDETDQLTLLFDRKLTTGEQVYIHQCIDSLITFLYKEAVTDLMEQVDSKLAEVIAKHKAEKKG